MKASGLPESRQTFLPERLFLLPFLYQGISSVGGTPERVERAFPGEPRKGCSPPARASIQTSATVFLSPCPCFSLWGLTSSGSICLSVRLSCVSFFARLAASSLPRTSRFSLSAHGAAPSAQSPLSAPPPPYPLHSHSSVFARPLPSPLLPTFSLPLTPASFLPPFFCIMTWET